MLYNEQGGSAAATVDDGGWHTYGTGARLGPETGADGQRAAVAHLRERRVL